MVGSASEVVELETVAVAEQESAESTQSEDKEVAKEALEIIKSTQEKQIRAIMLVAQAITSFAANNEEIDDLGNTRQWSERAFQQAETLHGNIEESSLLDLAKDQSKLIKDLIEAINQMLGENLSLDKHRSIANSLVDNKQAMNDYAEEFSPDKITTVVREQSQAMYSLIEATEKIFEISTLPAFLAKSFTVEASGLISGIQTELFE